MKISEKTKEKEIINLNESNIIEVYKDNFIKEINQITNLLEEGFNTIGIDTEFPGIIFFPKFENKYKSFFTESIKNNNEIIKNYNYDTIKLNVDNLKIIQIGISLYNPLNKEKKTYQFNLNFNIKKEKYSNSSIELLQKSGINFLKLQQEGIDYDIFSEYIMKSNLIFNEKITWITFHGNYDLAYLLKMLKNENLPNDEKNFLENLEKYFPNFYDLKFLLRNSLYKNYGLNKLAKTLNVENSNKSINHQAGYDSLITMEIFNSLSQRNFFDILKENFLNDNKNNLWGFGQKYDSFKLLEYLLKNPIFYNYYHTNYYYKMINGYSNNLYNYNSQVNYIIEKTPKFNKFYFGI
jgi:CCR4-NOT transcription complex subunit 7/8